MMLIWAGFSYLSDIQSVQIRYTAGGVEISIVPHNSKHFLQALKDDVKLHVVST